MKRYISFVINSHIGLETCKTFEPRPSCQTQVTSCWRRLEFIFGDVSVGVLFKVAFNVMSMFVRPFFNEKISWNFEDFSRKKYGWQMYFSDFHLKSEKKAVSFISREKFNVVFLHFNFFETRWKHWWFHDLLHFFQVVFFPNLFVSDKKKITKIYKAGVVLKGFFSGNE